MNARRIRAAAAALILAALAVLAVNLVPVYWSNLQLQRFVGGLMQNPQSEAETDEALRAAVLGRARDLGVELRGENVQIRRTEGGLRVDVRYVVRVDLPLYTVVLHFYPGAGSR